MKETDHAGDGSAVRLSREEVDRLADSIAVLAAQIDSATHQLLAHIRRFDDAMGWARQGAQSCAHWLSWRIGVDLPAAREKVRTARALGGLPKIDAALERGELSYSKVRAMTRVADEDNETLLVDMAKGATGAQLEKVVRGFRRVQRPAKSDDERRYVRKRHVPADGMVRIEMKLLPDEAERVWQALRETKLALGQEMDATAVASPKPNLADAAVAMAETQLASFDDAGPPSSDTAQPGSDTVQRGSDPAKQSAEAKSRRRPVAERRQLFVHLAANELEQGKLRAELHDGTLLDGETFLRLACDTGLVLAKTAKQGAVDASSPSGSLSNGPSRVLDVGRLSRTVSTPINRALLIRDRHCRWPGCSHGAFVEAHHLRHWAQGGETSLDNTLLLCHRHHQLAHEGDFGVERDAAGQVVFLDPEGRVIEVAPAPALAEIDPVERLTDEHIDRRTSLPSWDGSPLDLHAAVGALVFRRDRAERTRDPG